MKTKPEPREGYFLLIGDSKLFLQSDYIQEEKPILQELSRLAGLRKAGPGDS